MTAIDPKATHSAQPEKVSHKVTSFGQYNSLAKSAFRPKRPLMNGRSIGHSDRLKGGFCVTIDFRFSTDAADKTEFVTPYELFDLSISVGNRLDIQWSLFLTIHMAIFGGIIYVDRPLSQKEKIGAIFIYIGFAAVNYVVTANQFAYFHSLNQDIASYATNSCCHDLRIVKQVLTRVEGPGFRAFKHVILVAHLAMALLVIVSVIFDSKLSPLTSKNTRESTDSSS